MTVMTAIGPAGMPEVPPALTASLLSSLPRAAVLPPHHPGRGSADAHCFPYARWSAGVLEPGLDHVPDVVHCRGRHLEVAVDLGRGGRILSLLDRAGGGYRSEPLTVARSVEPRGVGLQGGIELNPTTMARSPWALDAVHAAIELPGRLGGDRLRWWEVERASGYLTQVDLHLPDTASVLLVVVRQVPIGEGSGDPPVPRLLVDDGTQGDRLWACGPGGSVRTGAGVVSSTRWEGTPGVAWSALSLGPGAHLEVLGLLPLAIAGLDDPVDATSSRTFRRGSDWMAVELARSEHDGTSGWDSAATPAPDLPEMPEVAHRRRGSNARQWLHLFRDEGLGVTDRVHPDDLGEAAGELWRPWLTRAHRREALGDWRVHLRLGELAYLKGDLRVARERWSWSYSLRPTVWVDRNLALAEMASGRPDLAAVRYLRAHRLRPDDDELATEAVGCLIAAGRSADASWILDHSRERRGTTSARWWLLEAEVAVAARDRSALVASLEAASRCADVGVHHEWWAALSA